MFDLPTMQRRFHDLTQQAADIRATSTPVRTERDQVLASITERVQTLEAEIKRLEGPLYEIEQERALLARLLNGKTGAPQ